MKLLPVPCSSKPPDLLWLDFPAARTNTELVRNHLPHWGGGGGETEEGVSSQQRPLVRCLGFEPSPPPPRSSLYLVCPSNPPWCPLAKCLPARRGKGPISRGGGAVVCVCGGGTGSDYLLPSSPICHSRRKLASLILTLLLNPTGETDAALGS